MSSMFYENLSPLYSSRLEYAPKVSPLFENGICKPIQNSKNPLPEIAKLFPKTKDLSSYKIVAGRSERSEKLKVGVLFSGGQAAGGHNVLWGLLDGLKNVELIGFLDGPSGLIENKYHHLDQKSIDSVKNIGGFDLIGSGRTKIETEEQFQKVIQTVKAHQLDALVIIGGDDSNTNAALLAERFLSENIKTQVLGVPKTIDGDLRSKEIELSFGFDSACRTYSEMIGNIAKDALSAKKYTHFIKLMGRSASHITLECALQTHPNFALIGEEEKSLNEIITDLANLIEQRSLMGKNYGIILIPEGLVEFIPEIRQLIQALNEKKTLDRSLQNLFEKIPEKVKAQFTLAKDPHGNIQVSQIDTEQILMELVKQELKKRNFTNPFHPQEHFFGYEGRSCFPTNFDSTYCYCLGKVVAIGIQGKLTGVIASIQNLKKDPQEWEATFVPIVQLMDLEYRQGKQKPVIKKALVDLSSAPYRFFQKQKKIWAQTDSYRITGPIQFFGPLELTDSAPFSLKIEY